MFGFKKKYSLQTSGLLHNVVDIHTHILPGVDDGFQKKADSLSAIEQMSQNGVSSIWLTPHIMHNVAENMKFDLEIRFEELRRDCKSNVELNLAAEYMVSAEFENYMKDGLLTFPNKLVMVENSCFAPIKGWENILFELRLEGYNILLAHPERYLYLESKDYEKLKQQHYRFQLDLFSLYGKYGEMIQRRAIGMLKDGMFDYIGSDVHNLDTWLEIIEKKILSEAQIKQIEVLLKNNALLK